MKVITLNKAVFSEKCYELISKVDFEPQLVVGILNGGGFVMQEVKNNFDFVNFVTVRQQRHNLLKNNKIYKYVLKLLPSKFSDWLRVLESIMSRKSIEMIDLVELSKQDIGLKFSSNIKNSIRSILIIDDAIDTGKTMFLVKNNLRKLLPNAQVKVAVISWTIEESIIKPDFYIFKNVLVRYPWSKDYKGKDKL